MSTADQAIPISDKAWEALQGAYDLQVHVAPDVIARRIDDLDLAKEFLARTSRLRPQVALLPHGRTRPGSHQSRTRHPRIRRNRAQPQRRRIESRGHRTSGPLRNAKSSGCPRWTPPTKPPGRPGGTNKKLPFWAQIQLELAATGINPPPMTVIDEAGELTPTAATCLELIRQVQHDPRHRPSRPPRDLRARARGERNGAAQESLVTHAEFPSQSLTARASNSNSPSMGAIIEHCFTTMYTGKAPWEEVMNSIRVVGPERCFISTDLGQTINPPVSEGFAMFAQKLLDGGFTVHRRPPHGGDQSRRSGRISG